PRPEREWASECPGQPLYEPEGCPATHPRALSMIPRDFDKFARIDLKLPTGYHQMPTSLLNVLTFIPNIDMYNATAEHAGYFNTDQDADGVIRKTNFFFLSNGKAYPSLPLEMARAALGQQQGREEQVEAVIDPDHRLASLSFVNSG